MQQLRPVKSLTSLLAALLVLVAPAALHAQATNNLNEDFTSSTTNNSWFFFNGACLTAGTQGASTNPGQIPSCLSVQGSYYKGENLVGGNKGYLGSGSAPSAADPAALGALRFTNGSPGGYHQNGAIVSSNIFPTGQGVQVTFKTVTYLGDSGGGGKDGADGISFYLLDGCMPISGGTVDPGCKPNPIYGSSTYPGIGAWGGSLAYTCSNANPPYDGLVGGYLGLGIDEYGNFLNGVNNTLGETGSTNTGGDNTDSGGLYQPGRIGLRGAGSVSWASLTTAYGTDNGSTSPYYPASLKTSCSNGGVYSMVTNSCGPVCTVAGAFYNSSKNTCDTCPAGTQFYSAGNTCNSCPSGSYDVNTNTCNPAGSCSIGSYVPATNTCNPAGTCSFGLYDAPTNTCLPAGKCSNGGYDAPTNTCIPAAYCTSGTLSAGKCWTCAAGTLDLTTGTAYCNNICPAGFLYKSTGQNPYPNRCYKCSNGNTHLTQNPLLVWSCTNGGSLSSTAFTKATSSATTTNVLTANKLTANKVTAILPTTKAPTTSTPSTGVPVAPLAVQKTCKTGHLYNYSNPASPTDVGPATLPGDPTNPNAVNTAGILNYPALPSAYSVLPSTVKIANESATTRGAASPIFYSLKITQDGLLSLAYSAGGGAYTNVINKLDITKSNGPLPSSFRFGFAGSTGGSDNIHEIMCFKAAPDTLAASSVGVNEKQASKIDKGTQAYFAYYDPVDSTGRVAAFGIGTDSSGNVAVASLANWDAACNLTGVAGGDKCLTTSVSGPSAAQSIASRTILTWNGSTGVPFEWTGGISPAQQTALGSSNVLDYLRGGRTNEIDSTGKGSFRRRDGVLGDVIDSSPAWVGPPNSGYTASFKDRLYASDPLPENSGSQSYLQFKQTWQTRQNVIYTGSNDGFLHAFRTAAADGTGTNDGAEILAYMPGAVLQTIHNSDPTLDFTSTQYGHNYFVDATPGSGDLFYNGTWHTWLAGGLGTGGAAIYVLDITDPGSNAFKEGNAGAIVIGEWTAGTDATTGAINCSNNGASNNTNCGQNLGNTYDTPQIRRLHNGMWGVIFGNGLSSATGDAGIYVMTIDPKTLAKTFYYLGTGSGTAAAPGSDGIAATASVDLDGDKVTDYVYAGDVLGNLWRFDLTSNDPTKWAVGATPVFKTPGQPITTAPVVGNGLTVGGFRRVMIAFGTGEKTPMTNGSPIAYLKTAQSLYGVWDWDMGAWNSLGGGSFASLVFSATGLSQPYVQPSDLQAQPVTVDPTSGNRDVNSAAVVCFAGATDCSAGANVKFGWSIALPGTDSQGTEQIVFNPSLNSGVFQVNSVLPADNIPTSCAVNTDKGWSYGMSLMSGAPIINFFPQYHDTSAIGVQTDATGTSFLVTTANGTTWLVYQTVTNTHETTQVNLPSNNTAKRVTWIQLR